MDAEQSLTILSPGFTEEQALAMIGRHNILSNFRALFESSACHQANEMD